MTDQMPVEPVVAEPVAAPKRRWVLPAAVASVVVVALVIVGVVLATRGGSSKYTVTGTLELKADGAVTVNNNGCEGTGGYSDITSGATVVVADAAGKTLALGDLLVSKLADSSTCIFGFTVDGVPAGKKFYGIEVSHRGFVQFSEAQLKGAPALSLGS